MHRLLFNSEICINYQVFNCHYKNNEVQINIYYTQYNNGTLFDTQMKPIWKQKRIDNKP